MTPALVILFSISCSTGEVTHYDPPLPLEIRKPMASIGPDSDWLSPEQVRQREKYESARRTL